MLPLISVVIPVYNIEKYIAGCLESVISQSYENLEIICVDDGSSDQSGKICEEYALKDSRIKVIHQKNCGQSAARNTGIQNSSGEYLSFIDGDDKIKQGTYKKVIDVFNKDVDVVWFGMDIIYEAHEEYRQSDADYYGLKFTGKQQITDELLWQSDCSVCNKIFKSKHIKDNNIYFLEGHLYEDALFYWQIFSIIKNAYYINDKLYVYHRRQNSTMSRTFEKKENVAIQHIFIMDYLYNFWKKKNLFSQKKAIFSKLLLQYFWFAVRNSPDFEKARCVWEMTKRLRDWDIDCSNDNTLSYLKDGKYQIFLGPEKAITSSPKAKKMKPLERLFCVRREGNHKVVRLFGLKIASKRKKI